MGHLGGLFFGMIFEQIPFFGFCPPLYEDGRGSCGRLRKFHIEPQRWGPKKSTSLQMDASRFHIDSHSIY